MRTDDKKHQCWLNEGETIRSFHPVLDCALREFADHDAFVSFIFEMVDIFWAIPHNSARAISRKISRQKKA